MSKGFTNLGNTCYMNAALQCLSHLPQLNLNNQNFINDIKKRSSKSDVNVMKHFLNLQHSVWEEDKNVVSTRGVLESFIKQCEKNDVYFESFQQNDTTDFLNTYMDFLHESIKRTVNININGTPKNNYDKLKVKSIETWRSFFENSYSYIIVKFYSQLLTLTSCPNCNYYTSNHEPIMSISLTLKGNYNNIYDCLNEFTDKEKLDLNNTWKCDKCKCEVQPEKKIKFWNLSDVLIFSIKTFRLNKKIEKHIEFPEELNMEDYCINNKSNLRYSLSGICIHGGNLHGGHYYAMCKDHTENIWRIHNDTHVKDTTLENVLSQTPYCLFYIKNA
jgi:ubiquitin C-terminal hydrolase